MTIKKTPGPGAVIQKELEGSLDTSEFGGYRRENLEIDLTEIQILKLQHLAYSAGVSVKELIEEMVEDLTGYYPEDTRDHKDAEMQKWYRTAHKEKRGRREGEDSFRYWLWWWGYTREELEEILDNGKFRTLWAEYSRMSRKGKAEDPEECFRIAKRIANLDGFN